jgi:hypothetical protein
MDDSNKKHLLGIAIPNIVSLVLIGGTKYLFFPGGDTDNDSSGVFIFAYFIIVPIMMGFISAYYWRDLGFKTGKYIGYSIINTLIVVALSFIFLHEGAICLLIVSPLILGFIVAGALVGRVVFRKKNNTLNVSLFGLLLVLMAADILSTHEYSAKVSDTMVINAPIDKVWPLVVEYEPITMKENYWLFKVGMPSPVQSTVTGHYEGAARSCVFSNGYIFDEKMIVYKPNEELTFDIVAQPRDPEIMGHIDIIRGQFLLKDNGDGTTTIIGSSWYKLYIFPVWYFDAWAESITRNVHIRVMEHIKLLSEKDV